MHKTVLGQCPSCHQLFSQPLVGDKVLSGCLDVHRLWSHFHVRIGPLNCPQWYPAPSHVTGYSNEIILATDDQTLGLNSSIIAAITPPDAANDTGQRGIVSQLRSHRPWAYLRTPLGVFLSHHCTSSQWLLMPCHTGYFAVTRSYQSRFKMEFFLL